MVLTQLEKLPSDEVPQEEQALQAQVDDLNASQRVAVETTEGPLLILAGAGTGKTRVLTTRIAYLVKQCRCPLYQILAVTFTNKAAQEMRGRVKRFLGDVAEGPLWIGTFHQTGLKILRRYHELLGLPSQFTILDKDDQLRLMKQAVRTLGLDDKKYPPRLALWVVERLKDRGLMPAKVTSAELARLKINPSDAKHFLQAYTTYQEMLVAAGAVDFGDLILLNLVLFQEHPEVLARYAQQFRYILVDEYQDTNVAQYLWLRLLAGGHGNLCCVGDDDQSIYGWRGAEVEHILRFSKDFPNTTTVKLEHNYRSTTEILGAASHLIAHNKRRLGKTLQSAQGGAGQKVNVRGFPDDREEARFIGYTVQDLLAEDKSPDDIAILVRAGFQTREIEERLLALGVPYRLVGAVRFYDRLEVKDALAYLRVVHQPGDNLAFERILNTPKRGLGQTTVQKLHLWAREHQLSLYESAKDMLQRKVFAKVASANLQDFLYQLDAWRQMVEEKTADYILERILDESGYLAMWKQATTPDAASRVENLKELVTVIQDFESLALFLEHVSLVTDLAPQNADQAVTLMTLHMAKGLEFDTVFLTGWEEGLFPHPKALEENGPGGAEEERRLAYVGLTRAKQHAWITFAWSRRFHQGWQQCLPSRFIEELPEAHIERDPGSFQQKRQQGSPWRNTGFFSRPPQEVPQPAADDWQNPFGVGARVVHATFGEGQILSTDGTAAEVRFTTGVKKIRLNFLRLYESSES